MAYGHGVWILGGVEERQVKMMFVCKVSNRNAKTLFEKISKYAKEGSIIVTYGWKSYNCLDVRCEYYVVNHSEKFKDPETGVY